MDKGLLLTWSTAAAQLGELLWWKQPLQKKEKKKDKSSPTSTPKLLRAWPFSREYITQKTQNTAHRGSFRPTQRFGWKRKTLEEGHRFSVHHLNPREKMPQQSNSFKCKIYREETNLFLGSVSKPRPVFQWSYDQPDNSCERLSVEVCLERGGIIQVCSEGDEEELRCDLSLCLILLFLCFTVWKQRSRHSNSIRQIIFSQHPPGGRDQAGIVFRVVLRQRLPGAQQRQVVPVGPGQEERRPALVLAVFQGVWERLAFAFR